MSIEIRTLWGVRKGFTAEYAELMVAWDEASVDNWEEGFEEACAKEIASWADDLQESRYITITVDREAIEAAFSEATVAGRVS